MSTGSLRERLLREAVLGDGAMGTMLQRAGLPAGHCTEEWNLSHPEVVAAVHRGYVEAGAQVLETNTLGANRINLSRHGLGDRVAEVNAAAVGLALAEAGAEGMVLASVGPLGRLIEPWGDMSRKQAFDVFLEQIQAQVAAGAHGVCIETFGVLEEALDAVGAAERAGAPNIACTMTFDTGGRTYMGVAPERAVRELREGGAHVVGANCGGGPETILAAVQEMHRSAPEEPLIAQANAGKPRLVATQTVFDLTPEAMAAYVPALLAAGVRLVGGCCGSTPEHIRAMASALGRKTTEASK
jgi:5-methyltetrahydrofolate--homocysteine methyltransferase